MLYDNENYRKFLFGHDSLASASVMSVFDPWIWSNVCVWSMEIKYSSSTISMVTGLNSFLYLAMDALFLYSRPFSSSSQRNLLQLRKTNFVSLSFFFVSKYLCLAIETQGFYSFSVFLALVQSVLGAFLWYQFSTLYFAWHLCPMIVNRICELIAFMFTGGMLPSLVWGNMKERNHGSHQMYIDTDKKIYLHICIYIYTFIWERLIYNFFSKKP